MQRVIRAGVLGVCVGVGLCAPLQADQLVVVTNPAITVPISTAQIKRIYLGKLRTLADGTEVRPLMLAQADALHQRFAKRVLGRSARQLRAYWARQLFTGKSRPPLQVASAQELRNMVAADAHYIGYLLLADDDPGLRVVLLEP